MNVEKLIIIPPQNISINAVDISYLEKMLKFVKSNTPYTSIPHKNPHNIQSITQFLSDIFGKTKK